MSSGDYFLTGYVLEKLNDDGHVKDVDDDVEEPVDDDHGNHDYDDVGHVEDVGDDHDNHNDVEDVNNDHVNHDDVDHGNDDDDVDRDDNDR